MLTHLIEIDGQEVAVNTLYSHRNFSGRWFLDAPLTGVIYCSCFSREDLDTEVFHPGSTATFINCNLDNVVIPPGCTVKGGSNRRFTVQNDLRDWEIDHTDTPVKVLNEKYWVQQGISVDPADIPATPLANPDEIMTVMSVSAISETKAAQSAAGVIL